jgi:hypothetical protein
LTPEDFAKVMDLLKLRPMQFCMFLKALVGAEEMQRMGWSRRFGWRSRYRAGGFRLPK